MGVLVKPSHCSNASVRRRRTSPQRIEKKHNKARANTLLAIKLGRAVYWMWKRRTAFQSGGLHKVVSTQKVTKILNDQGSDSSLNLPREWRQLNA